MACLTGFAQSSIGTDSGSGSDEKLLTPSLSVKRNFQFNMLEAATPVAGNNNNNVLPYIGVGFNKDGLLGKLQFYGGVSVQRASVDGDFNYVDTDISELAKGNATASFGAIAPFLGAKCFLKEGDTRPYVNLLRIGYVPTLSVNGEIEVNGDRIFYESSGAFASLARSVVSINTTEIGFGVEHFVKENLALFAEYNFRTFQFKLKIKDAEQFVDDLDEALNELEAGADLDLDIQELQSIQGDGTARFRNLTSYASLGLSIYF